VHSDLQILLLVPILITLYLIAIQYGYRFLYGYRIGFRGVEIQILSTLTVWTIPFDKILSVEKAGWKDFHPFHFLRMRGGNRLFGIAVLLKFKNNPFDLLVTPNDADDFVRQVKERILR
jgi:hypothetical protein